MENQPTKTEIDSAIRALKMNPGTLKAFNLILTTAIRSHYATLKLAVNPHEVFRSQGAIQTLEKIVSNVEKT